MHNRSSATPCSRPPIEDATNAAELFAEALERFDAIEARLQAARTAIVLTKLLRTNGREQEAKILADRGARLLASVKGSLPEAAYTALAG